MKTMKTERELPIPVKQVLEGQASEEALERVWAGVQKRRGAEGRPPRALWLALAVAGAGAGLAAAFWPGGRVPAPLALATGDPLAQLLDARDPGRSLMVPLSDGSRLDLEAGTRIEVGANTGRDLHFVLRSGQARFAVRPGGGRRWQVETGLLSVEVTGTRFVVTRGLGTSRVTVEEGHVRVSSAHLRPSVQELGAGGSVEVRSEEPPRAEPPRAEPARVESPRAEAARVDPVRVEPAPKAAAKAGPAETTPRIATPARTRGDGDSTSPDALLRSADAARLAGRPQEAVVALERVVHEHPTSPKAAVAAFTLGRVLLDELDRPSDAARAFGQARALGLPATLGESACARLVEAQARAGDTDAARRAAEECRRRYPGGRFEGEIRRWVAPP